MGRFDHQNSGRSSSHSNEPFDDSSSDEDVEHVTGPQNHFSRDDYSSDSDASDNQGENENVMTRGYMVINWDSDDENRDVSTNPDAETTSNDTNVSASRGDMGHDETQENATAETTASSRPVQPLDEKQADLIKNIMAKISLPATAFPSWASAVSDDQLKNAATQLIQKDTVVKKND